MIHLTSRSKFNTSSNAVNDVRLNELNEMKPEGDRFPAVVSHSINPNIRSYGVQYLTLKEIDDGEIKDEGGAVFRLEYSKTPL